MKIKPIPLSLKVLNKISKITLLIVLFSQTILTESVFAQQIDVDSLLQTVIRDVQNKQYDRAIHNAQKGIELAPEYLDFYQFLGRAYQLTGKTTLAEEQYRYVIERNTAYKEVFGYWFSLEVELGKFDECQKVAELGIQAHPDDHTFYLKKLIALQLKKDEVAQYNYIRSLPPDVLHTTEIQQQLSLLEIQSHNNRIGANYAYTTFDRNGVGPWHLGSAQFIHQRHWGSLIGGLSYADRTGSGNTKREGTQYEIESYINTSLKNYSYFDIAYSDDKVFPKWRLAYSYYQNFNKGWEGELGIRYAKYSNSDNTSGVFGIGKYIGSYWINLRHFMSKNQSQYFPSFTLTTRLYTNTRFDYYTVSLGYGSSPEDRVVSNQFQDRVSLDSYRFGAGYSHIIDNQYIVGLGINYNNQEFAAGRYQNEWTFSTSFQYKF